MDVSPYIQELAIAPRAVFDSLPERATRVRFMIPTGDGDYRGMTWAAFAEQIRNAALFLASQGLESTQTACIFSPNCVEWLSAALGIQAAGGVMVPIYPNSTADQAAYIVEHSDARFVFVSNPTLLGRIFQAWSAYEQVERIILLDDALDPAAVLADLRNSGELQLPSYAEVERKVLDWSASQKLGAVTGAEQPELFEARMNAVSLDQPGLMLYTSGTTGRPKGVPLTHRNSAVNGRDWLVCNAPLVEEGDVDLLWLPMSHVFGFGEACLGNTLGWTSYLGDPHKVLDLLPRVRPHIFMSVPRYFEKLAMAAMSEPTQEARAAKLAEITGGRFRFCLSGGAGLKAEVKTFFKECGLLIIEGYGLTEASPTLTLNRPDHFRFDSVGKPLPSVEIKLAEDGEILARGPSIFGGYHKDPEATEKTFTQDGWLCTGDIGRFTEDGFLQIIDRKKEILVTAGGKNVPPANIEMRFADEPMIAHLLVYGDSKPYLVAGVWLSEEAAALSSEDAQARIAARIEEVNGGLARYETVKRFRIMEHPLTVEGGLLTATLKVRRKKVYEAFQDDFEGLYRA